MFTLLVWLRYVGLAAQVAKIAWRAWIEIKPLIGKSGFSLKDIPDVAVEERMEYQAAVEESEVLKQKIKLAKQMEKLEKKRAKLRMQAKKRSIPDANQVMPSAEWNPSPLDPADTQRAPSENAD